MLSGNAVTRPFWKLVSESISKVLKTENHYLGFKLTNKMERKGSNKCLLG